MKKLLKTLIEDGERDTRMRDMVFRITRDLQRASKAAIYALQRNEVTEARVALNKTDKELAKLAKLIKNTRFMYDNNYLSASEEYLEAYYLLVVLQHKTLVLHDISVPYEQQLGALCDMTGELVRRAVNIASESSIKELMYFKEIIEALVSTMARMFLTGHIRQKFDEAKRNLHKLEEIIYHTRSGKM